MCNCVAMEMESKQEQRVLSTDKPVQIMDSSEKKLGDFCLICFSKVDRSKKPKQSSLLSNNLNVIFLLRNLLQVPSDLLIGNFKKCGSPFYWISLCENCSQLTRQAMEHHLQILKLVNQLRSVLQIITDKMRETAGPSETMSSHQDVDKDDKKKSMQEKRLQILRRTREFVTNYNYNTHLVNPFIEGDKRARELDEDQDSSSSEDSEEDSAVESENEGTSTGGPFEDNLIPEYLKVDGMWKCRHCDKLFSRKSNLRDHEQRKHPPVPGLFKCNICGKRINSKKHLLDHISKTHKPNAAGAGTPTNLGKWKCRFCEKRCLTKQGVFVHEDEKHPEVPGQFGCDICGKKFNSKLYLSGHRNKVHNIKTVRSSGVIIRRRRRRRQVVPEVIDKWTCQHCDKEFKNKYYFTRHQREQHPTIPGQFKCDICGITKNSRFGLLLHRRSVHKINAAGNPVTIKPRDYTKEQERRRLKPKTRQTCHLCGKSFSEVSVLKKHLKCFHDKQFDKHCHVCGLGVWGKQSLNMHLLAKHKDDPVTVKLIEDGFKVWKCGVVGCRAVAWKESSIEEHKRKVHGDGGGEGDKNAEKRYTCAFCGKTFWYWYRLKVHEISHKVGNERPHCCDLCGAKFKWRSSIKKHKKRFHSEIIVT